MTTLRPPSRRAVLGSAAAVMSAAGRRASRAAEPVRIGFSIARTGYLGVASPVMLQSIQLWRDEVNARGGLKIAGDASRQVELIYYDDESDPTKAAEIYGRLIGREHVDLLLAPFGTPFHIAIAPIIERHRFPLIAASALSTLLRDLQVRYMFFTQPLPDTYGAVIADFMVAQKLKSAAVLTLQLPASLETRKFLEPRLKAAGISIVEDVDYASSITDMTGMLSSVKAAAPDAVIGLSYPNDGALYMGTARELGIAAKMQFLLIGPSEAFFAKKFSKAEIDGVMTIGEWSPKQTRWPGARAFSDAYAAKWNEPPDYLDSVINYVACQILEQAVGQVGLDHGKLRDAIAQGTFSTIKGPIRFEHQVNVATEAGLLQIQGGEIEIVWPADIATAAFRPKAKWA